MFLIEFLLRYDVVHLLTNKSYQHEILQFQGVKEKKIIHYEFLFHLLGDVPSPTLMGYVADHHSLQAAFILPVIAMAVSSAILFYGMRFALPIGVQEVSQAPTGASS